MPINEKIRAEVKRLGQSKDIEDLMLALLDRESDGLYGFNKEYDNRIKRFLEICSLKNKQGDN